MLFGLRLLLDWGAYPFKMDKNPLWNTKPSVKMHLFFNCWTCRGWKTRLLQKTKKKLVVNVCNKQDWNEGLHCDYKKILCNLLAVYDVFIWSRKLFVCAALAFHTSHSCESEESKGKRRVCLDATDGWRHEVHSWSSSSPSCYFTTFYVHPLQSIPEWSGQTKLSRRVRSCFTA